MAAQTITITTETLSSGLGNFFSRLSNFNASQFEVEFQRIKAFDPEIFELMLASESLLAREWDSPEEDNAWANM